jgi:replication-associated recombination protein RarA
MSDFLWVEKYRPRLVKDTILPAELKEVFEQIISTGELPNMLFTGTPGVGKTTVAKALCNELELDFIVINGSEEGNIDYNKVKFKFIAQCLNLTLL